MIPSLPLRNGAGYEGKAYDKAIDEEVAEIAKLFNVEKASGPDGVLNLALKEVITEALGMFRSAMQKWLDKATS